MNGCVWDTRFVNNLLHIDVVAKYLTQIKTNMKNNSDTIKKNIELDTTISITSINTAKNMRNIIFYVNDDFFSQKKIDSGYYLSNKISHLILDGMSAEYYSIIINILDATPISEIIISNDYFVSNDTPSENCYDNSTLKLLGDFFKNNFALQRISLTDQRLGLCDLSCVMESINLNLSIRSLTLEYANTNTDFNAMFHIRQNKNLRHLHVHLYLQRDEIQLAEYLSRNNTLTKLYIFSKCGANTAITIDDVMYALSVNSASKIKKLYINGCRFSETSSENLGSVIEISTSLVKISITNSILTYTDAKHISNGLRKNNYLRTMILTTNIQWSSDTRKVCEIFLEAILENDVLRKLRTGRRTNYNERIINLLENNYALVSFDGYSGAHVVKYCNLFDDRIKKIIDRNITNNHQRRFVTTKLCIV